EDQSDDDADAKLPLEAKPYVDEHRDEGEAGREQAVAKQLAADPGADDLCPADLHTGQRLGYSGRDHSLGVLQLRLVLEANQNVLRRAELLHSEVIETERCEGLADLVDLQRLRPA